MIDSGWLPNEFRIIESVDGPICALKCCVIRSDCVSAGTSKQLQRSLVAVVLIYWLTDYFIIENRLKIEFVWNIDGYLIGKHCTIVLEVWYTKPERNYFAVWDNGSAAPAPNLTCTRSHLPQISPAPDLSCMQFNDLNKFKANKYIAGEVLYGGGSSAKYPRKDFQIRASFP